MFRYIARLSRGESVDLQFEHHSVSVMLMHPVGIAISATYRIRGIRLPATTGVQISSVSEGMRLLLHRKCVVIINVKAPSTIAPFENSKNSLTMSRIISVAVVVVILAGFAAARKCNQYACNTILQADVNLLLCTHCFFHLYAVPTDIVGREQEKRGGKGNFRVQLHRLLCYYMCRDEFGLTALGTCAGVIHHTLYGLAESIYALNFIMVYTPAWIWG